MPRSFIWQNYLFWYDSIQSYMALNEVAIICFSLISCFGILALAYFKSEERKEQIRSSGITQRAQMKLGQPGETTSPYGSGEWAWLVPIVTKLLEIPAIQALVAQKVQSLSPEQLTGIISQVSKKE
jgi:hypothetical protein